MPRIPTLRGHNSTLLLFDKISFIVCTGCKLRHVERQESKIYEKMNCCSCCLWYIGHA